jgi:hypothetical protein
MKKILEILVVITVLLPLAYFAFFVIISLIVPSQYEALVSYQEMVYESLYLKALAVFTCIILVSWVTVGEGSHSKLWMWMPPFVFFNKFGSYGRIAVVVVLVVGTLIGLFGEMFGVLKPNVINLRHKNCA